MKTLETRQVMVVRCDVCGAECFNYTTFNPNTPEEKHACSDWNEALQMRCEDKLRKDLASYSGVRPDEGKSKPTRSELMAKFGQDYISDADVGNEAGCCSVCFDIRGCVEAMQCKANLSTLTKIAPDPADEDGMVPVEAQSKENDRG